MYAPADIVRRRIVVGRPQLAVDCRCRHRLDRATSEPLLHPTIQTDLAIQPGLCTRIYETRGMLCYNFFNNEGTFLELFIRARVRIANIRESFRRERRNSWVSYAPLTSENGVSDSERASRIVNSDYIYTNTFKLNKDIIITFLELRPPGYASVMDSLWYNETYKMTTNSE